MPAGLRPMMADESPRGCEIVSVVEMVMSLMSVMISLVALSIMAASTQDFMVVEGDIISCVSEEPNVC